MSSDPPSPKPPLEAFLEQYWKDREASGTRQLHEYLAQFPGDDRNIVREYRAAEDGLARAAEPDGQTIGGYRILGELGRGGQGVVYLAQDPGLPRKVALKVLTGFGPGSEEALERFRREAAVTSRLEHPGICPVYESGMERGVPYIAMRFIEGESLAHKIAPSSEFGQGFSTTVPVGAVVRNHVADSGSAGTLAVPSTEREIHAVLLLVEKAARALHVAHEAKIIHRDIKPGNIMVTPAGEPVIMDFGLARDESEDLASLTQTGDRFGTPAYMSPEQVRPDRGRPDRRTDVWSLGATLYECMTLRRPFDAPTREGLYRAILSEDPSGICKLNRNIPDDLKVVVETALERDRNRRYQTAGAFAEDLRRVRQREPILAKPVSRWTKLVRWAQRNPAVATLAAAVFLSLSGGLVTAWILKGVADSRAEELQLTADTGEAATLLDLAENALWPATEEIVPQIDGWLRRAEPILKRLPEYRRELEALRASATPLSGAALAREEAAHVAEKEEIAALEEEERSKDGKEAADEKAAKERLEAAEKILADEEADEGRRERAGRARSEALAAIDRIAHKEELVRRISTRRTWIFADGDTQARHDRLALAVSRAEELKQAKSTRPGLWAIESRRAFAESLEKRTIDDHRSEWVVAIARVAANPKYSGMKLAPQVGLIPLGRDPASALEEFCETATGEPPVRDGDGKLLITERTAIVFVLLPGGKFTMGAQAADQNGENFDPAARNDEGPPQTVTLDAFLLSKYEMTQGQWSRIAGENPSYYRPGTRQGVTLRHPVEYVSWDDGRRMAGRLGLSLPSEAQWEYGCRGGTWTRWWPGDDATKLQEVAFLADESWSKGGGSGQSEAWNDGYLVHGPVGSFLANPFGLHDVHGNVWELCEDAYRGYVDHTARPGEGLRTVPGARDRVVRGGSFNNDAVGARSSNRFGFEPGSRGHDLGVRFATPVSP